MRVIRTEGGPAWLTFGLLLALLALLVDVVFIAVGQVDIKVGLLIAAALIARLI